MSRSFAQRLKTDGNLNRIVELQEAGYSASDIQSCFATGGLHLVEDHGDLPLLRNLHELGRKALPRQAVRDFLSGNNPPLPA